jgi:uncharacterized membrane protein YgcG
MEKLVFALIAMSVAFLWLAIVSRSWLHAASDLRARIKKLEVDLENYAETYRQLQRDYNRLAPRTANMEARALAAEAMLIGAIPTISGMGDTARRAPLHVETAREILQRAEEFTQSPKAAGTTKPLAEQRRPAHPMSAPVNTGRVSMSHPHDNSDDFTLAAMATTAWSGNDGGSSHRSCDSGSSGGYSGGGDSGSSDSGGGGGCD